MCDLICDVITCCVWSCDTAKIFRNIKQIVSNTSRMLLLELLYKLHNSYTSLPFWILFTCLKFLNELNIKSSLSQNFQYHSAIVSLWPRICSTSWRSQHTLFALCHSDQTIFIIKVTHRSFRHASPHLWNQLPTSLRNPHPNYSSPFLSDLHLNMPL